jgi:2-polyprenyl-3-methyl-5-hydroxy-6-metoxy-1,4-benzoquinol methylase
MSHLDYYVRHGISPVRYQAGDLRAHFERRASLYRSLHLTPLAIRGSDVLEVAAGSGQNSLYVAAQRPASLTLLEPNPTGVRDIKRLYGGAVVPHTKPALIEKKLEDFEPARRFDIAICENWLGASAHERALLRKLAGFIAPDGMLVVTAVSPIGFLPNVIRRALSARLRDTRATFEVQSGILVSAFQSHLATLESMTRTPMDWVQDNMLNPAYFDLCLSVPMLIEDLGGQFQVLGSNPQFAQDWRWFKSLHGERRRFNEHFLDEYFSVCHGFLDHRLEPSRGPRERSVELDRIAMDIVGQVSRLESALLQGQSGASRERRIELQASLRRFIGIAGEWAQSRTIDGLSEALELLESDTLDPHKVSKASSFVGLFGRETLYVSLQRIGET